MAKKPAANRKPATVHKLTPKSQAVGIAKQGIRTSNDFANLMAAMMTDLAVGALAPQVGNAMCNAGGKLLKIVEMQHKYGMPLPEGGDGKILQLARG